jgi:tRNA(fMet)-specific endonuclease VapC
VAQRIAEVGPERACTSIVMAAELRFGAAKHGDPQLEGLVEGVLDGYADCRRALAEGTTLVTANEREFARVEGLDIEKWAAWRDLSLTGSGQRLPSKS